MHRRWPVAIRLIYSGTAAVLIVLALGCGSTSVTQSTAPDSVRCQTSLASVPSFPAAGGKVEVGVMTERECAWTAISNSAWIQISPSSGQGEASITLTGAANPQGSVRNGNIAVNGAQFAVTQAGAPCTFTLNPNNIGIPAEGSSAEIKITTLVGCSWTASSPAGWITVSPTSGTDSGGIRLLVAENSAADARSATLTIAGRTAVINQAGTPPPASTPAPAPTPPPTTPPPTTPPPTTPPPTTPPPSTPPPATPPPPTAPPPTPPPVACVFTVDPVTSFVKGKGDKDIKVRVNTSAGCAWSARSNVSWAEIKGDESGVGSRELHFDVDRNRSDGLRFGTITIGSATHFIVQRSDD
jgi:BACON domain-containing protein